MVEQRTIRAKACWTGIGLHSGQSIRMEILPAPEDNGITFTRTDCPGHAEIRACVEHVVDTTMATSLGAGVNGSRATVGTVEHVLAALAGLGIDNARVYLDGPEVPIMDGSAKAFTEGLLHAGVERQNKPKRFLALKKEVTVQDGDKLARLSPGRGLHIQGSVDFDHPLISTAPFKFEFSEQAFVQELAEARTFGFLQDVEALQANGLARGGSLDNAIVIDRYRVLNPEGLRYSDEFVRHKILDAIGDLSLVGLPVLGKLTLHRSGHALNTKLVDAVLNDPKAYEVVEAKPHRESAQSAEVREEAGFWLFESAEGVA